MKIKKKELKLVKKRIEIFFNGKKETFNLWQTFLPQSQVPLFLIENKDYFSGPGVYVESDASSGGSEMEAARFLFLSAAGIQVAKDLKTDLLHCHDWHVGIIPFLLKKEGSKIKTLFTIHNLAYQGIYPEKTVNNLLNTDFSEKVNCVKLGIMHSDFVSTVSPSYAKEILTTEFGFGLETFLQKRKDSLRGILNGLDDQHFNSQKDSFLKKEYSWKNIEDKIINKEYLQKRCFGKSDIKTPFLGIVSRIADQKGFDLIKSLFNSLMKKGVQFILLGKGSLEYEKFFQQKAKKFPEQCWVKIGFDEKLAHQIYGGTDIFLMPSFFEPCGLGQQIAMKYGTVPVARAVGGIKDTVFQTKENQDKIEGNGFLFEKYDVESFMKSIENALNYYPDKNKWQQIQINGMKQDCSWEKSAKKYLSLYQDILKK